MIHDEMGMNTDRNSKRHLETADTKSLSEKPQWKLPSIGCDCSDQF